MFCVCVSLHVVCSGCCVCACLQALTHMLCAECDCDHALLHESLTVGVPLLHQTQHHFSLFMHMWDIKLHLTSRLCNITTEQWQWITPDLTPDLAP